MNSERETLSTIDFVESVMLAHWQCGPGSLGRTPLAVRLSLAVIVTLNVQRWRHPKEENDQEIKCQLRNISKGIFSTALHWIVGRRGRQETRAPSAALQVPASQHCDRRVG